MKNHQINVGSMQQAFWNRQHSTRGVEGREGDGLKYTPNFLAPELQKLIPRESNILEIGCANGRDARFFSSNSHRVLGVDFSEVALMQMMTLAHQQGCERAITPIVHDINHGLPELSTEKIDCFYARSSLHVNDRRAMSLFQSMNAILNLNGVIAIEGKDAKDISIKNSKWLNGNLAVNWHEGGQVRRIWTQEFCVSAAKRFGWKIISLGRYQDPLFGKFFLRFIAQKK